MRYKRKIFIGSSFIFLLLILLFFSAFFLFELSKSRTYQVFGEFIPRVEINEKVVALTFDDGPTGETRNVLEVLTEKNVKGTFFLIGEEIDQNREVAREIVVRGHDIGNHSYSHQRFYFKSQDFIHQEISKTNELIRSLGYGGEITFRPPNGKRLFGLPWYLQQNDIKTIYWDVEPDTFVDVTLDNSAKADFIVNYTIANTKPGSIILLHPHCGNDCEADRLALPRIINELQLLGYRFVTINELLNR